MAPPFKIFLKHSPTSGAISPLLSHLSEVLAPKGIWTSDLRITDRVLTAIATQPLELRWKVMYFLEIYDSKWDLLLSYASHDWFKWKNVFEMQFREKKHCSTQIFIPLQKSFSKSLHRARRDWTLGVGIWKRDFCRGIKTGKKLLI